MSSYISGAKATLDLIELSDPDPTWPEQFDLEAAAIRSLGEVMEGVQIEHFGSTAVPNLRAKPVIDIMLVHPRRAEWPRLIAPLEGLGYVYWAENPRKDRMLFVKGMPPHGQGRTHHVHVRLPWDAQRELAFRDRLRSDPVLARDYARLKEELAAHFAGDRDAYTDAKTDFISAAVKLSADVGLIRDLEWDRTFDYKAERNR